jgi:hypothetical protein
MEEAAKAAALAAVEAAAKAEEERRQVKDATANVLIPGAMCSRHNNALVTYASAHPHWGDPLQYLKLILMLACTQAEEEAKRKEEEAAKEAAKAAKKAKAAPKKK